MRERPTLSRHAGYARAATTSCCHDRPSDRPALRWAPSSEARHGDATDGTPDKHYSSLLRLRLIRPWTAEEEGTEGAPMRVKPPWRRAEGRHRRKKASAKKASAPPKITAEDVARLDTWMTELAASVHGAGREEASGDWRFGSNDALVLHPTASGMISLGWRRLRRAEPARASARWRGGRHPGRAGVARRSTPAQGASLPATQAEDEDAAASLLDAENDGLHRCALRAGRAGHREPRGHGLFRRPPIRHRRHRGREPIALAA